MDLSKVKVGDEVFSCLKGWMKVQVVSLHSEFPVETKLGLYMLDGRASGDDINPEITDWKPQKREWKPKLYERGFVIGDNGRIDRLITPLTTKEDRVYSTETQAKHAYKSIRACQILNAYVAEFAPDWRADWDNSSHQIKYFVKYNHSTGYWNVYDDCQIQTKERVYMPKETAVQLCKDLNEGVVKL